MVEIEFGWVGWRCFDSVASTVDSWVTNGLPEALLDRNQLERCVEVSGEFAPSPQHAESPSDTASTSYVSLEAEIPEVLYRGMKDFIGSNANWDQYRVMSSALANFLFQNGCSDRVVTERYLDDLFSRSQS